MNEPHNPSTPATMPLTGPAVMRVHQEQDALAPGTRLGEFEILSVLGIGGFGIVYLAMDHALERQVAIKEYMPSSLAGRGQGDQVSLRSSAHVETFGIGLRSFVNEAKLLARFDHPSLVKVYRFWEANGTAYMVMPFYAGRTLRDERKGMTTPPDEAWIRRLIDPLLGALEVLHKEGVYHRDIAPDNILLLPEGLPVLLDFGAARRVIGDRTQTLTAILKPNYAPVEQYADVGQLRQGPWTDLYALGAVLHFLVAGKPPTPSAARAVHDDVMPLAALDPALTGGLPHRLLAAVDWALMVRPNQRPQSVQELRDALDGRLVPPERVMSEADGSPTVIRERVQAAWSPTQPERSGTGAYAPTAVMLGRDEAQDKTLVMPQTAPPPPTGFATAETPRTVTQPQVRPMEPLAAPAPVAAPSSARTAVLAGAGAAAVLVLAVGAWTIFQPGSDERTEAAAPAPATAPVVAAPPPVLAPALAAPASAVVTAVPAAAPAAVAPVLASPQAAAEPALTPREAARLRAEAAREALAERRALAEARRQRAAEALGAAPPAPAVVAPPAVAPAPPVEAAGPRSPREACGSRVFIALTNCLRRQCESARFASHPECERMRHDEEMRQRNPLNR